MQKFWKSVDNRNNILGTVTLVLMYLPSFHVVSTIYGPSVAEFCTQYWTFLVLFFYFQNPPLEFGFWTSGFFVLLIQFLLLGMKCNKCVSWPVRKPRNSHGISAVILSTDHDHWTSAFGAEELRPISLEIASCRINRNININIDIMHNDFS